MAKRQAWADIMRGLGIISVVFGHIYGGFIHDAIFIYHMPLFFFIGGSFFKPVEAEKKFIKRQFSLLIVPYISFGAVIFTLYSLLPQMLSSEGIDFLDLIIRPLIGGKALVGALGVFWFISCYFILKLSANFFFLRLKSRMLEFTVLVFFILSFVNSIYYPNFWLPGNVHVVLAAFPLFYIGYRFQRLKIRLNLFLLASLSLGVIISLNFFPLNTYDMKYAEYGIPFVTLISSMILILFIKALSYWLSEFKISKIFKSVGKASLVIMYVHLPFKILLDKLLIHNQFILTILTLSLSYLTYELLNRYTLTRKIFIGQSLNPTH